MQKLFQNRDVPPCRMAWAAGLVLTLAGFAVAGEPAELVVPAFEAAATGTVSSSIEVGELLYGRGKGAWGSPERVAARLARQAAALEKRATLRATAYEQLPISAGASTSRRLAKPSAAMPRPAELPGRMAEWFTPLGTAVLIVLGITAVYTWSRSRGFMGAVTDRIEVISVASAASVLQRQSPRQRKTIARPQRSRGARRSRWGHYRMMRFPMLRVSAGRNLHGEFVRQLQTLGILPLRDRETGPRNGGSARFAFTVDGDLQMYGGGSDPIPNYAYTQDAQRMLAQIEREKAAHTVVWCHQRWRA